MNVGYLFRLLVAIVTLGFVPQAGAAVTFSVLAKLGAQPDGYTPSILVVGSDHNFYGTTVSGGTSGDGTVFRLTPSGTLTTLYSFSGGNDGANPMGPLAIGTDGNLYGTTSMGGGTADAGTFFQITLAGVVTTLHAFNGTTEGDAPAQVTADPDGNFYAAPAIAGTSASLGGAILKLTSAGAVTILHTFNASTEGSYLNPQLTIGSDGALYGTASAGGANGDGTIFRATTTGTVSILAPLTGSVDSPVLVTTLGNDGFLYGVDTYANTVFKMTNAGVRTTVYTFTKGNDGSDPTSIIQGSDGNFYGTSAAYGADGYGTFFKISSTGSFQELYPFPSTIGALGAAGDGVAGLVEGADGDYYATGPVGGSGLAGTIVQLTTSGTAQTIYNFISPGSNPVAALLQASDGNLYGTTEYGGDTDDGAIFQVTTSGSLTQLASLDFATTGSKPQAPLIQDPTTGNLFGSASAGGPDYDSVLNLGGAVFYLAPADASSNAGRTKAGATIVTYHVGILTPYTLWKIRCLSQFGPLTPLIMGLVPKPKALHAAVRAEAEKGAATGTNPPQLFGVSALGGDNNEGVFFDFQPSGTVNTIYSFGDQSTDGVSPEGALALGANGNLYGTTAYGGTSTVGTIYEITPASGTANSTLTTIHSFAPATGSSPESNNLVVGTDGNIYGTTTAGGANGGGVVFQMTPTGTYKVLHNFLPISSDISATNGSTPAAGLVEGSDHNFYGTTELGGTYGIGTVYSISPTGVFTLLHSFNGQDGFQPQAALIQASDGNLYGVTTGNSFNNGVIFKIDAGLPIPKGTTAQTITFPAIANQTLGTGPVALGASASSGLAVTYTVSGPATLSGSSLTLTGVGTVKVTASQAGNSTYAAATPVAVSFTVGKGAQTITFPAIADQTFGEPAFTLSNPPTASSALAVTLKVLSGPATISGTKVTLTGAGVVTLAANQAGNTSYAAATQVTSSFTVDKAAQSIAPFAPIALQYEGEAPFVITLPKASSGLAVTVTVQSGPATIAGDKVSVTGTGTVTLAANQAGNANDNAAPQVTTAFTVGPAKQTIAAFAKIAEKQVGAAPFAVTIPKASSGLPVSVTVQSGPATISSGTITVSGAGTVVLAANQAGDADFSPAAQVTTSFVVNGLAQTITAFSKIATQTFGEAPFAITPPIASSGLAVTVTVQSGPATIDTNTVTLTGAGAVVLAASQAGNAQYNPAKAVTTSFVVSKEAQTLAAFSPISGQTFGTAPFSVTPPVANSGLTATLTVKSGPAKIAGNIVTLTGVGTVVLEAAQAGNASFTAATPVTTSFTVTKGSQAIGAFDLIPVQTYGEPAFAITPPTSSSGLAVTVSVLSGPAKIAANKITVTGTGTVELAANQAGNADYTAAAEVTTNFVVDPATQTIAAFKTIAGKVFGAAPFAVVAPVASSKLPIMLSVLSGPATISGTKVTLTGAGTVELAADQAGNADYTAAAEVTTSFVVAMDSQKIKPFAAIAAKTTTSSPFTITPPIASSGLPVAVTVVSGPATISGNTVTLTGTTGTVVLAANQAGNANYDAALEVTVSFAVK
jgi:uncharacterized repeat protein (TIGR03803 family)